MRLLIYIAIVGSLVACGSGKNTPAGHLTTTVKDSTVTEVRYQKRDTLITIPGDTLKVSVPYTEITKEPKRVTQGNQTVVISKDDLGNLNIDCITAAMDRIIELEDRIETTLRTIESNSKEVVVVPERYTPWYTKTLAWIGGIFLAVLGLGIITKKFIL